MCRLTRAFAVLLCVKHPLHMRRLKNWNLNIGDMSRSMKKPTKWHVHPVKAQIRLGIRPVWSESSLFAWRKLGSLATHLSTQRRLWSDWANAQADLSLRWAHKSFCWFRHDAAQLWCFLWINQMHMILLFMIFKLLWIWSNRISS